MTGHFEKGAWIEEKDQSGDGAPFMKIYFCVKEKPGSDGTGPVIIQTQPIFRKGMGEKGTELRRWAVQIQEAISTMPRIYPETVALREELRDLMRQIEEATN